VVRHGLGQPVRRRPGRPGTWGQRRPAGRGARPGGAAGLGGAT